MMEAFFQRLSASFQQLFDRDKKKERQWGEVDEYRALLEAPDRFEEGFTSRTIIGVLFISLIMTPGEMFLGLYAGIDIGVAAQWVTVILFLEISKRSFAALRRQEIYLLVYVAGALIAGGEGAFLDLLWRQYFVTSAEAELFGIAHRLPSWWVPGPDSEAIAERTFIHRDWLTPILLLVVGTIMGRIAWFTTGYMLFRLVSDREQLPFPTAPMSALSAMALAEDSGAERETWKWPVFSIGAVIGASFGGIYVGVPVVTEIWGSKVEILPIPFWELSPYLGNIIQAAPLGISTSLGAVFAGLFMPFWGVIGSFAGVMLHTAVSPVLYAWGYLPRWELGMYTIETSIVTGIDFWRAFSIGITIAVTIVSFHQLFSTGREKQAELREKLKLQGADQQGMCKHSDCHRPAEVRGYCLKHLGRGDFNLWVCASLFCVAAIYPIVLAKTLFPALVSTGLLVLFVLIAFVWAPIMSFVSARLDGLVGRNVSIPHVEDAIRFMTGFRGVEIWFVPFPARNFGGHAEGFRVVELTGMKFTSLLKAELFMLPIVLGVSLMYWTFLWRLGPIPSESYPYAQIYWPLQAFDRALAYSATMYSKMWRAGEELEGDIVPNGQVVWSPPNLEDGRWWYWRVSTTRDLEVPDPVKRDYEPWSQTGYFYTDFSGGDAPPPPEAAQRIDAEAGTPSDGPQLLWPPNGMAIATPNPNFRAAINLAPGDSVDFYFEVDRLPSFDGEALQRSSDMPLLFEVLWQDMRFTGNRKDDDGDLNIAALVESVEPEGVGGQLGLADGDRIRVVNGVELRIPQWDTERINRYFTQGADSVFAAWERDEKTMRRAVVRRSGEALGLEFAADTSFVESWTEYDAVRVATVAEAGLGHRLGLQAGDYLMTINGQSIEQDTWQSEAVVAAFAAVVEETAATVLVEWERDGDRLQGLVADASSLPLGLTYREGAIEGIDEELVNNRDDDGDGLIDEDTHHPLGGRKWPIIIGAAGFGLVAYFTMTFLGMPIFMIWGYVQSVTGLPHNLILQIIGALLARHYFWKRYGMQQWRQYAMVLFVGFGVGMALVGMFSAALSIINKAVSSLPY
ncbi:MAG: hypothetical protein F4Z85_13070 [Gemmatimonadetes bacterium]|nr:hypothetical protein [Gemmatimonadota bacterium]MYB71856.1 hypothetical protein [Gemmatimonadota bacterium]